MTGRLEKKVAMVTGAGSGIGRATSLRFALEGASVAAADIDGATADETVRLVKDAGGRAQAYRLDVTKKAEVERVVAEVEKDLGPLNILVNNAGINRDALVKKMTEEQWDLVLGVNLKGTFLCAQAAAAVMAEHGSGRIINTASIGMLGNVGQANYAASKAGVAALTCTLALELARYKITVNCVAPGGTDTPMTRGIPPEIAVKIKERIPLKRFAEPDEIAAAHLFFASDDAAYITGQLLFVDGGLSVGI